MLDLAKSPLAPGSRPGARKRRPRAPIALAQTPSPAAQRVPRPLRRRAPRGARADGEVAAR
eukprot:3283688-Lingulodinium_polyedra.AAC.1